MGETIHIELITPSEVMVSEDVAKVIVPNDPDDLAVLPRRAPMLAHLRAGLVSLLNEKNKPIKRIVVSSGFVDIKNDICTIVTEEAIPFEDIDRGSVAQRLTDYKRRVKAATSPEMRDELRGQINFMERIIALLEYEDYLKQREEARMA